MNDNVTPPFGMSDPHIEKQPGFEKLGKTPLRLAESDRDIRGRTVRDPDGEEVGRVSDLIVDPDERKVRLIEIESGGFLGLGAHYLVMPVEAITSVADDDVFVSESLTRIAHAPVYDPELLMSPTQEAWNSYYTYYGIKP